MRPYKFSTEKYSPFTISLNEEKGILHHLEILSYELGFNKHMINVILDDAKRYNLSFLVDKDGAV